MRSKYDFQENLIRTYLRKVIPTEQDQILSNRRFT